MRLTLSPCEETDVERFIYTFPLEVIFEVEVVKIFVVFTSLVVPGGHVFKCKDTCIKT